MIPKAPTFAISKQNRKFTAGCIVSIDSWCPLSAGAQQWSGHGSDLQIIAGSLLNWHLRGSRLFHDAGGGPVLKMACCLGRSRAPGKKREAGCPGDESNLDGCFGTFRLHEILDVNLVQG
jgi:hypothetical protein